MAILSDEDIRAAVGGMAGWEHSGGAISRDFDLGSFPAAVAFVVRLAFEAEAADHHPDLDIRYRRVKVALSTHSEGGVTARDLDLARRIDGVAPAKA